MSPNKSKNNNVDSSMFEVSNLQFTAIEEQTDFSVNSQAERIEEKHLKIENLQYSEPSPMEV
jgi:hypothetical protein